MFKSGEIEDALVVAPKAPMGSWYRDIETFFSKDDQAIFKKRLTIINYDMVWRRKFYDKVWGCVVLDESHKIKNRASNRGKFLLKLALKAKNRYILTGTPISNGQLENIWSQYAFLLPEKGSRGVSSKVFGTYKQFEDKHCILNQYWKPYRYQFVDEIQDVIAEYSYSVKKTDCLDLPAKLPDEIYDIELLETKLYKELVKSSTVEEMEIVVENPLSRLTMLRQVCSGWINDGETVHELKCEKIAALQEFLDGWEKKLVIFCHYTRSIDKVSALLSKLKIKHVTLDGRQKDKMIWRKFQNDPKIQIIVCQYDSGSTGIDLFAADTTLYFEPTLSSNTLDQSRDRTHRQGQTTKCSYIHFITQGTVEVAIYKALKGYSDFSERLFKTYMTDYQKGGK